MGQTTSINWDGLACPSTASLAGKPHIEQLLVGSWMLASRDMANCLHCTVSLTPNIDVLFQLLASLSPLWVPGNEILAATHKGIQMQLVHSQFWVTTGTVTAHIATPPATRLMFNKYQPRCRIPVGAILGVPPIYCRKKLYRCGSKPFTPSVHIPKMLRTIFVGLFIYPSLLMYVKHIYKRL